MEYLNFLLQKRIILLSKLYQRQVKFMKLYTRKLKQTLEALFSFHHNFITPNFLTVATFEKLT